MRLMAKNNFCCNEAKIRLLQFNCVSYQGFATKSQTGKNERELHKIALQMVVLFSICQT
jgi:hypothetical protein